MEALFLTPFLTRVNLTLILVVGAEARGGLKRRKELKQMCDGPLLLQIVVVVYLLFVLNSVIH